MIESSDHVWSQENIAAYVAGGLSAQEAERLEAHARECIACADALGWARAFDGGLAALFTSVRPGPDLEDRVVFRLRTTHHRPLLAGWVKRTVAAAAAIIILGTVGALVGPAASGLPLPGQTADADLRAAAATLQSKTRDVAVIMDATGSMEYAHLTNEDLGVDGVLPALAQSDKRTGLSVERSKVRGLSEEREGKRLDDQTRTYNEAFFDPPTFGLGFSPDGSSRMLGTNDVNGKLFGRSGAMKELRAAGGESDELALWKAHTSKLADGTSATIGYANGTTPTPLARFNPVEYRTVLVTDKSGKTVTHNVPVTVTRAVTVTENLTAGVQKKDEPAKVEAPDPKPQVKEPTPVIADPMKRIILRSGEIEFEVDAFETASAGVQKLVDGVKGAYVATINSEKLANGKVKGSLTVRVPPEHLDGLVSALRKELDKNGGLKGVRIGSSDVTKQYYDIDSRLRAARTMEQRILQIIKEGKGDIKVLLEAEKQLGEWRTQIETYEGEIRYYNNLAALSTLTITLTEKEIRAAASLTERERVQAGVEVEDVEKTYQQLLAAIADAKGRVSKSEMKQLTAGQFNATINFEVAPETTGPVRDRLNQLGRVARLEIDRFQDAEGGTMPTTAKAKRGDTVFLIQLYNLANIEPREAATLQVAVENVPTAYQALRDAVAKATGARVLVAQLNEQDRQNVTAQFDFEVRRPDEAAVRVALDGAGEVVGRQITRAADSEKVTDAKVMYKVALLPANRLKPREVTTLGIEVANVDATAASFAVQVKEAGGRPADSKTTREANGRVIAKLVYEVPLTAAATLAERFKSAGDVRVSQSVRDPQASEGRYATARLDVTLSNAEGIVADDAGVWKQVRRGLSYSASVLLRIVTWVVVGLCVVLPLAIIGYAGYRMIRRSTRPSRTESPPPAAGPTAA